MVPDRVLAAKLGLSTEPIGIAVDVFMDGRKIDDYKYEGEEIDLVLAGLERLASRSQDLAALPIATPDGQAVDRGRRCRRPGDDGARADQPHRAPARDHDQHDSAALAAAGGRHGHDSAARSSSR